MRNGSLVNLYAGTLRADRAAGLAGGLTKRKGKEIGVSNYARTRSVLKDRIKCFPVF